MNTVTLVEDSLHADVEVFRGFSIRENAGTPAAAALNFRAGSVGGPLRGVLELTGDESATIVLSKKKINAEGGLYVEVVSGSVEGVLYYD